ncbi:capsular polysaccharide synthesis protein [Campylobacter sp. US33a]|uniref:Capsular polysaccharide synthesis protein n=1 Tax=Campylobacter sp. CCS1377 TaxID=3158229 RepID=A0AAU7E5D2_9BACT|nr:capsular polysaccharide synthesis protein [Campylobacter sp. US33a]TEY03445.1 glycosyl transferase [Campylobacter sp. US33a]
MNLYNNTTHKLSKLIPIRPLRRKLRTHIAYKMEHPKVSKYLDENYIQPFLKGKIPPYSFEKKQDFKSNKIIWQLWFQGEENASDMIKQCFKSVKKQMGDEYEIIILNEKNIKDYLDFPPFVLEKITKKTFGEKTIVFFSDLLRVSLLATYGGIWCDASIFLSDKIPQTLRDREFFAFERAQNKPNKEELKKIIKSPYFSYGYFNWNEDFLVRMFSSFVIAKVDNISICALRDILMNYWQKEKNANNHYYFVLHIIYELLKQNNYIKNESYENKSDIECHLLQFHAKDKFNELLWQDIKKQSFLHKLTHFRTIKKDSCIDKIIMQD